MGIKLGSFVIFCLCFTLLFSFSTSVIVFPLTRAISGDRFASTNHLLKFTADRSAHRFRNHHRLQPKQVSLPLSQGSDYTLSFTLNTNPPQSVSLFLDTGSDLVWFPCHPFECVLCEDKQPLGGIRPVNLSSSTASKVDCKSPSCSAVHSKLPSSDLCVISGCPLLSVEMSDCHSSPCPPFYYAYGDGSLVARLFSASISLPLSSHPMIIPNFTFGCSHSSLGEPVGVAGFGQGVLSLPAQLASYNSQLGSTFSYCLVPQSFSSNQTKLPSPLILGRVQDKKKRSGHSTSSNSQSNSVDQLPKFVYTSLLDNPKSPFFYLVGLESTSVGKSNIPAPEFLKKVDKKGTGGMVVDSGTTFTMLPSVMYSNIVASFEEAMEGGYERAREVEANTGLGPCYYSSDGLLDVPELALTFSGSEKLRVMLPTENYFYEFMDVSKAGTKRKVGCLMLMNGGDEKELAGGPGATLGNFQQQGFQVVYDLEHKRVGFSRRECSSLWDSLNNGRRR